MKVNRGLIKVQEDNSKKPNPKLAVEKVIYTSVNGSENGLNTEGFIENIFTEQLDPEILSPTLKQPGNYLSSQMFSHLVSKKYKSKDL